MQNAKQLDAFVTDVYTRVSLIIFLSKLQIDRPTLMNNGSREKKNYQHQVVGRANLKIDLVNRTVSFNTFVHLFE